MAFELRSINGAIRVVLLLNNTVKKQTEIISRLVRVPSDAGVMLVPVEPNLSALSLSLKQIASDLKIKTLPDGLLQHVFNVSNVATDVYDEKVINEGFTGTLREHQHESIKFALKRRASILAIDLGGGKTAISIGIMLSMNVQTLIVCPAGLRSGWNEEITKFAPQVHVLVIKSKKHFEKVFDSIDDFNVVVVSFALISSIIDQLLTHTFELLIADEAHFVKNQKSDRSKVFKTIAKKNNNKIIFLSATPAQTHQDIFHLLHVLSPTLFSKFHHYQATYERASSLSDKTFYYAERYCEPSIVHAQGGRLQLMFKGSERVEELRAIISPYCLRMLKHEFVTLPDMTREKVTIGKVSKAQSKELDMRMGKIEEAREKNNNFANAQLMELCRMTMRSKIASVLNYITAIVSNTNKKEKIILFAHHMLLQEKIVEQLAVKQVAFIHINGSTPMKKRPGMIEKFKDDEDVKFAVLSLGACSTGLNLQFCSRVVYCELIFNSITHTQAEGRVYRIGQKNEVLQQYLFLEGSTDTIIWRSIAGKVKTESKLLDEAVNHFDVTESVFSKHDVEFIFDDKDENNAIFRTSSSNIANATLPASWSGKRSGPSSSSNVTTTEKKNKKQRTKSNDDDDEFLVPL